MDGVAGQPFAIRVEELQDTTPEHVRTLIDIDLQTFAESTFSPYTAAVFLQNGRVFLLKADDLVIGTCVCVRCWDRPNEAMILSVGIRPGWRGRGLGQRFVRSVMEGLEGRGLRSVSLLVGSENRRAIKVYEDVGFERVGVGLSDPHRNGDMLLMRARLREHPVRELPAAAD
ncbi:MAG: ribosomal protein S18 acetylase RimI-like enzyme [Myxococcota bacterium]|jgi:ribosomal protein S18 acetylase RimI-like enzyme